MIETAGHGHGLTGPDFGDTVFREKDYYSDAAWAPRPPWLAPPTFQCEGATVSVEPTRTLVRIGVKKPIPQLRCMVARTSGSSSAAYERRRMPTVREPSIRVRTYVSGTAAAAPGGAGHYGQDRRGGQSQQQQRAGEMPGQQGGRMSSRHDPLPSAVIEILPNEIPQGAAGPVVDHEPGIEPHRFPARPQPPVEFVVLISNEGRVDAAHRLQRIAPERAQEDGVDRPPPCRPAGSGRRQPPGEWSSPSPPARSKNVVPTGRCRPPTLAAPVLCNVLTARRTYPGGNTEWASHRTMISPVAAPCAARNPKPVVCSGLGISLTVGYRRRTRSDMAAVSDPSATITSTEPS